VTQNPHHTGSFQCLRYIDWNKGNEDDMNPTPTQVQQSEAHVQNGDWCTSRLPSCPVALPCEKHCANDIGVWDIGVTLCTCCFAETLWIQINIRGVSSCFSTSQSCNHRAIVSRSHEPHILALTEGISRWITLSYARFRGSSPWGRHLRLWPWGMLANLLALIR
jgi:hypothetical protein